MIEASEAAAIARGYHFMLRAANDIESWRGVLLAPFESY